MLKRSICVTLWQGSDEDKDKAEGAAAEGGKSKRKKKKKKKAEEPAAQVHVCDATLTLASWSRLVALLIGCSSLNHPHHH